MFIVFDTQTLIWPCQPLRESTGLYPLHAVLACFGTASRPFNLNFASDIDTLFSMQGGGHLYPPPTQLFYLTYFVSAGISGQKSTLGQGIVFRSGFWVRKSFFDMNSHLLEYLEFLQSAPALCSSLSTVLALDHMKLFLGKTPTPPGVSTHSSNQTTLLLSHSYSPTLLFSLEILTFVHWIAWTGCAYESYGVALGRQGSIYLSDHYMNFTFCLNTFSCKGVMVSCQLGSCQGIFADLCQPAEITVLQSLNV